MAEWDVVLRATVKDTWQEEKRSLVSFSFKIAKMLRGDCFPCSDHDDDQYPMFEASLQKADAAVATLKHAFENELDVVLSAKQTTENLGYGFKDAAGDMWIIVKAAEIELIVKPVVAYKALHAA